MAYSEGAREVKKNLSRIVSTRIQRDKLKRAIDQMRDVDTDIYLQAYADYISAAGEHANARNIIVDYRELKCLTPKQVSVFAFRFEKCYSIGRTARAVGVSPDRVKKIIHEACERIAEAIKKAPP